MQKLFFSNIPFVLFGADRRSSSGPKAYSFGTASRERERTLIGAEGSSVILDWTGFADWFGSLRVCAPAWSFAVRRLRFRLRTGSQSNADENEHRHFCKLFYLSLTKRFLSFAKVLWQAIAIFGQYRHSIGACAASCCGALAREAYNEIGDRWVDGLIYAAGCTAYAEAQKSRARSVKVFSMFCFPHPES